MLLPVEVGGWFMNEIGVCLVLHHDVLWFDVEALGLLVEELDELVDGAIWLLVPIASFTETPVYSAGPHVDKFNLFIVEPFDGIVIKFVFVSVVPGDVVAKKIQLGSVTLGAHHSLFLLHDLIPVDWSSKYPN